MRLNLQTYPVHAHGILNVGLPVNRKRTCKYLQNLTVHRQLDGRCSFFDACQIIDRYLLVGAANCNYAFGIQAGNVSTVNRNGRPIDDDARYPLSLIDGGGNRGNRLIDIDNDAFAHADSRRNANTDDARHGFTLFLQANNATDFSAADVEADVNFFARFIRHNTFPIIPLKAEITN